MDERVADVIPDAIPPPLPLTEGWYDRLGNMETGGYGAIRADMVPLPLRPPVADGTAAAAAAAAAAVAPSPRLPPLVLLEAELLDVSGRLVSRGYMKE